MKYILSGFLVFAFAAGIGAQTSQNKPAAVEPKVDERIELTSIVARLAGYEEYREDVFKDYAADVDEYFGKFKNHAAVEFARELRQKRIGFDAVANFAVRLETSPVLRLRVAFDRSGLDDDRWTKADAEKFAGLLRKFYRETDFRKFFRAHRPVYEIAAQRFRKILDRVNFAWYRDFYGEQPDGHFNLVVSLLNGHSNYGPKVVFPNGKEDLFSIIGTWKFDDRGRPAYDERDLPIIVHEFGHSFNNRLIAANEKLFEKSGAIIFPQIAAEMNGQGYGKPVAIFIEGLLRACVIRYLEKNPLAGYTAEQLIGLEEGRGFIWTGKLVELLAGYENSRSKYPTLASFMPRVVEFFDDVATRIPEFKKAVALKYPKVLAVAPLIDEAPAAFSIRAAGVDENTREIRIGFSRKMMDGIDYWITDGPDPFIEPPVFDADGQTLIGKVRLAPNSEYGIVLPVSGLRSFDGFPMNESYRIYFTTRGFTGTTTEKPVGYRIDDDELTFVFDRPVSFRGEIESVRVAGDFNGWNPQTEGFALKKKSAGHYELSFKLDDIVKKGERKLFKFVINDHLWIEAPTRALNAVKDNGYLTLFLERK